MHVQQAQAKHLLPLDGLRGVAILMVLLFHVGQMPLDSVGTPLGRALDRFASIGWTGVDLFFVLSGFLITRILLDARDAPNYYLVFYARRVLRLFPLYYLSLIVFFWIWPLLAGHFALFRLHNPGSFRNREQLWYWFDLVNLRTAFYPLLIPLLTHYWTLSMEEQFYAVWPVVVRHLRERWMAVLALVVIIGTPLLRALPWVQSVNAVYPNFVYRLTPFNLDTLLCGALIAVLWRHVALKQLRLGAAAVFALTLPAVVLWGSPEPGRGTVAPTVLAVMFGALLLLSLTTRALGAVFSWKVLRWMGKYSYSVYLLHPMVINWTNVPMAHLLRGRQIFPGDPYASFLAQGAVNIAMCFLVARSTWALIESPMLRLKRFFRYQIPGQEAAPIRPAQLRA